MNAQLAYLETEVMTASPPKLRLLLIEGALRLARQSLQSWEEPMPESVFRALSSLRKIILQLLTCVEGEDCGLGRNIQSIYMYLFSTVTKAQLSGDARKISEVVKVLEVERETWKILTQRFVAEVVARQPTHSQPAGASSTPAAALGAPAALDVRTGASVSGTSFSLLA